MTMVIAHGHEGVEAKRICIVGTGLIGVSIALALRSAGFEGEITGVDRSADERAAALATTAFNLVVEAGAVVGPELLEADVVVLAVPVLAILDWMERLAPVLGEGQLVTDVGSTKVEIAAAAGRLFNGPGKAAFLPGHPMAGKESGGAALGDAELFRGATWLFTPGKGGAGPFAEWWRGMVERMGARVRELSPERHDEVCAWVSHLPQMVSTALAAVLEDTFAGDAEGREAVEAIGGRALRETTRLGASPYSMWRDVAMTNTEPIAETLLALEQRLAHMRENLRTPGLREEFATANRFRAKK
jgi:prephenate dehydrogenase